MCVVKSYQSEEPRLDLDAFELLATTGALPRTQVIPLTTRGTRTSRRVAAAIRTTTIRITLLEFVVPGVLNKIS